MTNQALKNLAMLSTYLGDRTDFFFLLRFDEKAEKLTKNEQGYLFKGSYLLEIFGRTQLTLDITCQTGKTEYDDIIVTDLKGIFFNDCADINSTSDMALNKQREYFFNECKHAFIKRAKFAVQRELE